MGCQLLGEHEQWCFSRGQPDQFKPPVRIGASLRWGRVPAFRAIRKYYRESVPRERADPDIGERDPISFGIDDPTADIATDCGEHDSHVDLRSGHGSDPAQLGWGESRRPGTHMDIPLTPPKVWQVLNESGVAA